MGKFRDHKIEEKRKLRNARQKRKRKQRSAERKASGSVKLQQANEDRLKEVIKLRTIARVYCCKWRDKCAENQRLKDSLQKSYHRTPVSNAFFISLLVACSLPTWRYLLSSLHPNRQEFCGSERQEGGGEGGGLVGNVPLSICGY